MKGISLPIETVVILMLAGIVLVALLLFFMPVFKQTDIVKLEQERAIKCHEYVQTDKDCNNPSGANDDTKKSLENVCKGLKLCSSLDRECLLRCCEGYCPQVACVDLKGECKPVCSSGEKEIPGTCSFGSHCCR
ncbi:MAG: hypothetical protein V1900_00070 [Candidatus Aenigmatarchaeota archaeon]